MSDELGPAQQLRQLSAGQKATIRRGINDALSISHARLATTCRQYILTYGISYRCLRLLMDDTLPNYLDLSPESSRQRSVKPPPQTLTQEQADALLESYKSALVGPNRKAQIDHLFSQYGTKYGVTQHHLRQLITADRKRYPAEYRALDQIGLEHNPPAPAQSPTKKKPKKARKNTADPLRKKPSGVSVVDYFARSTFCPMCHVDFSENKVPPHSRGTHHCQGSGRFGITLYEIHSTKRAATSGERDGYEPGTVSGGLPGHGRRR